MDPYRFQHLLGIAHRTQSLSLSLSVNHSYQMQLYIFEAPDSPVITGKDGADVHLSVLLDYT